MGSRSPWPSPSPTRSRAARRRGCAFRPGIVSDGALWVGIAALVGGRLLYVAQNGLADLAAHPAHILMVWMGGLSFYGGLAAGLIALVVFARRRGVPWRIAADVAAPAVAIGQAIGHIGCLIGGDSAGIATDAPWAVVYRNPAAMAQLGVPLHPTQAYEAIALAALFVVLWAVRRRLTPMPGALAAVYLGGLASHQVPALLPAGRGSGAARAQDGPVDRRRHPRRGRLDPASPPCAWPVFSARHPRYRRALAHDRAHESIQCPRCALAASPLAPPGPRGCRARHRSGCRGLPARRSLVLYAFSMGAMLLMHAGGHGGHGSGHADHEARSAQDGDDSPAEAGNEGHKGGGCH